jgi:hypothetical protein
MNPNIKSLFRVGLIITLGSLIGRTAVACDNVFVESINGAPSSVTEALTMNSVPADSLGFSLASAGSRIDTLPVGTNSPSVLNLAAQISLGSLSASCSTAVTNNNVTGQCSGVVDPKYKLLISYTPGTTGTGGSLGDDDNDGCKHDNGNHWGEYRKLDLIVPPHSGKPNAGCKHHDKDRDDEDDDGHGGGTPGTPASLSCQFVQVPSF